MPREPRETSDWSDLPDPDDTHRNALTPHRAGDELRGHILEEELGDGAMGVVWRARHAHLNRNVAIKALHPDLCTDAEVLRRFFREAQVVNALNHPNIVRIIDFVDEAGSPPYIIMEYLEGDSLATLLSPDALLRLDACYAIARQTADAMALVHDRGMVHRDLKPDNVFVERNEGGVSVKLVDFGLAKFHLDNNAMLRTQTGAIVGTPMYMAPEQIRGQQVDSRCDIYAMGCILYALLTGDPPFTDEAVGVLLKNHLYEPPVPPTAKVHGNRRAAIPPELERAILRCLSKEPELRLQTMRELTEVLDTMSPRAVSSSSSLAATPVSAPAPTAAVESIPAPATERERDPEREREPEPEPEPEPELVPEPEPEASEEKGRITQKVKALPKPGRQIHWWYGAAAVALLLVGGLIAVWVGRLSRSPRATSSPSTTAPTTEQAKANEANAPAWPRPTSKTRRIRVLTVPTGAALVNPRTGQTLWRTPSLVTLPEGHTRTLSIELARHKRHTITLSPSTRGPLRIILQKLAAPRPRRAAPPRPMQPRPRSSSPRLNDFDTVDPFK